MFEWQLFELDISKNCAIGTSINSKLCDLEGITNLRPISGSPWRRSSLVADVRRRKAKLLMPLAFDPRRASCIGRGQKEVGIDLTPAMSAAAV